jgi:chloramphenicol O-acetyltransferase
MHPILMLVKNASSFLKFAIKKKKKKGNEANQLTRTKFSKSVCTFFLSLLEVCTYNINSWMYVLSIKNIMNNLANFLFLLTLVFGVVLCLHKAQTFLEVKLKYCKQLICIKKTTTIMHQKIPTNI